MNVLLFLLPLLSGANPVQAPRPTTTSESEAPFREIDAAYKADRIVYDQARVDAARGKGAAPTRHPVVTYWPRMEEAAQRGSTLARRWMCENITDGVPDPTKRLAVVEAQITALLACCAGDTALLGAATALRTQVATFGLETSMRHLDRIAAEATNPEVQARALLETAFLTDDRGRSKDPAQHARAAEIQNSIVLAFPTTRAAQDAAELLNLDLQREFLRAMSDWVGAAEAAFTAGRPVTEWPASPLEAFAPRFEVLARTGQNGPKSWMEDLYRSYVQVAKLAPDYLLSGLARELGRHYAARFSEWGQLRMRILALALRVHGGEAPWLKGALERTTAEVHTILPLGPLPFTTAVLELARSSEARASALWIEVHTRLAEGSEAEFTRAIAALDTIVEKHADMTGLAPKAADLAARVRAAMPGAPVPDTRSTEYPLKDYEDLELVVSGYRGKVLLLDVFEPSAAEFASLVPERRELVDRLAGRPFAFVGLSADRSTLAGARATFEKLGVTWRVGLLQTPNHPYIAMLFATRRPSTTVLVDADGVIRARNRPFAEMARLATELTAERERALQR